MPARSRRVAPGGWHPAALLRLPAPQDGHYAMDPASMLEGVDENTIMVVPTLGVTYTGADEPIEAMSRALDQLQTDTGLDIGIHVDGASGAFLAPFCAPDVVFDFVSPASSRSAPRAISSAWLRWASAGSSGGTDRNSPTT